MTDDNDTELDIRAHDQKMRVALQAFEYHEKEKNIVAGATLASGTAAIRTLLLLNGGAAIAMLAFIGNIATLEKTDFQPDVGVLAGSLIWFAFGALSSGLAFGIYFFANSNQYQALQAANLNFEHPYVRKSPESKRLYRIASSWSIAGLLFTIASIIAFSWGAIVVWLAAASL